MAFSIGFRVHLKLLTLLQCSIVVFTKYPFELHISLKNLKSSDQSYSWVASDSNFSRYTISLGDIYLRALSLKLDLSLFTLAVISRWSLMSPCRCGLAIEKLWQGRYVLPLKHNPLRNSLSSASSFIMFSSTRYSVLLVLSLSYEYDVFAWGTHLFGSSLC